MTRRCAWSWSRTTTSFRETLELLFGMRDEVEVVGSVATGDDAVGAVRRRCGPTSC